VKYNKFGINRTKKNRSDFLQYFFSVLVYIFFFLLASTQGHHRLAVHST